MHYYRSYIIVSVVYWYLCNLVLLQTCFLFCISLSHLLLCLYLIYLLDIIVLHKHGSQTSLNLPGSDGDKLITVALHEHLGVSSPKKNKKKPSPRIGKVGLGFFWFFKVFFELMKNMLKIC